MTGKSRGRPSAQKSGQRLARNPDLAFVAVWFLASAMVAYLRRDFTGDGVRHLPWILETRHPRLGEPRWLLFPGFLFVVLRPFVALHVVDSVEGLTHPMMAVTLLAGLANLLAIRSCLVSLGVSAPRRAAALGVAAFSAGLLFAATDLMEPIFGSALALGGLAYAARRHATPGATPDDRRRAVLVAVTTIALASLLYQGVILAVGLLPLVVGFDVLRDRRVLLASAVVLAMVPIFTIGVLCVTGDTARHALERFAQGEENPFYRTYLKKSGIGAYVVALVAGPPQGVVALSDFHGFRGVIGSLRSGVGRTGAFASIVSLGLGSGIVWGFAYAAWKRGDTALLTAAATLLILPLVRHQQYGYIKYYILLPAVLAVAASRSSVTFMAVLAAVIAVANGIVLIRTVQGGRRLYAERVQVYQRADANTCWMTSGWGPPISFRWPGTWCAVLGSLASGSGNEATQVVAQSRANLDQCLRDCFCGATAVYTDDMAEAAAPELVETESHFGYTDVDLTSVLLTKGQARVVSSPEDVTAPVYEYTREQQRRVCSLVSSLRHE